jgi:hypothetical protein
MQHELQSGNSYLTWRGLGRLEVETVSLALLLSMTLPSHLRLPSSNLHDPGTIPPSTIYTIVCWRKCLQTEQPRLMRRRMVNFLFCKKSTLHRDSTRSSMRVTIRNRSHKNLTSLQPCVCTRLKPSRSKATSVGDLDPPKWDLLAHRFPGRRHTFRPYICLWLQFKHKRSRNDVSGPDQKSCGYIAQFAGSGTRLPAGDDQTSGSMDFVGILIDLRRGPRLQR